MIYLLIPVLTRDDVLSSYNRIWLAMLSHFCFLVDGTMVEKSEFGGGGDSCKIQKASHNFYNQISSRLRSAALLLICIQLILVKKEAKPEIDMANLV